MHTTIVLRRACAAVLLAAIPSVPLLADSSAQEPPAASGSYFQLTPRPSRRPFAKLFVYPAPDRRSQVRAAAEPPRPRVVCGTRVIPVAPGVDPKIHAPRADDTRHTIRAVPPPICRADR